MLSKRNLQYMLTVLVALVWLVNGLFCKVLNLVPRHKEIVSTILGETHSGPLNLIIGFAEIGMAIWVISQYKSKWSAWMQMITVGLMNLIEFTLAPELLLWGKFNLVFALFFILIVYYNEFVLGKKVDINALK